MFSAAGGNKEEMRHCLEKAFKEVDVDNSGFIDSGEVERVLKGVYTAPNFKGKRADDSQIKKEADDMITSMDQNGDNKVSLSEFISFFEKVLDSSGN